VRGQAGRTGGTRRWTSKKEGGRGGSRGDEGRGEEAAEARSAMFSLCGFARRRGSTCAGKTRGRERKRERGSEKGGRGEKTASSSEEERSPLTKPK